MLQRTSQNLVVDWQLFRPGAKAVLGRTSIYFLDRYNNILPRIKAVTKYLI